MSSVIALGSINVDVQVSVEAWPRPGTLSMARDFLLAGGGKAANVAFIARRLGIDATLIGRVGDDVLAEVALRPLRDTGVDLRHTRSIHGQSTAVSSITVGPGRDKIITLAANANRSVDPDIVPDIEHALAYAREDAVLVVDFEVAPEIARHAIEAAHARGIPVVLDPSPAKAVPLEILSLVACVTPNPTEAEHLTELRVDSVASAREAGVRLRARGARAALVKLGEGGCVLVEKDSCAVIRAESVCVVDKTGAGDAFAGAVAVALSEKRPLLDAARYGVAASTIAVGRFGSQASYPDRDALESAVAFTRVET
jgi:ribokinase